MPKLATDESVWLSFLENTPVWNLPELRTVVVSPHPDDETLGAGGLIAAQAARGVTVSILAVSDGEAAYPDFPALAALRRREQQAAAEALGVDSDRVIRFGLPDSGVAQFEDDLARGIAEQIDGRTLLIAPWGLDPHPDHEACGRAALAAARGAGAAIAFYFFWAWHRNTPKSLSRLPLGRVDLAGEVQARRADALACHRSQLYRDDGEPILPEVLLAPARRSFETFIVPGMQA